MRINEIFYSLQGEGRHTGKAAVFIRLSGCNLKCPFCDTDFFINKEMREEEIVDKVCLLNLDCHMVVITGGEPTIQDCTLLIDLLHRNGYYVAMESNGTHKPPFNVDWLTVSPKSDYVHNGTVKVSECNELKVVFNGNTPSEYNIKADYYYLQPCDTGDEGKNKEIINKCVQYIKKHPKWRLSLQTQKIINVR